MDQQAIENIQFDSIKAVAKKIDTISQDFAIEQSILAFDIDLTLTRSNHPATFMPNIKKYYDALKDITKDLTTVQKDLMLNLAMTTTVQVVEEDTLSIIANYQANGIKVIAFTASLVGKVGNIAQMKVWRYTKLKELGFDFSTSFSEFADLTLADDLQYLGGNPTFYQGILMANSGRGKFNKGTTLVSFLNKVKFFPKLVILVDDSRQNLEEVALTLNKYDNTIKFMGIEYTAGVNFTAAEIAEVEFINFWEQLVNQVKNF